MIDIEVDRVYDDYPVTFIKNAILTLNGITPMAQEKKGGFFSFFKKRALTPEPAAAPAAAEAPATRTQSPVPSVSAEQPKPAVVQKPAAANVPSAEAGVDTIASFTLLCEALVDINRSQLKMVDLALTTLAGSINTIADALKPKS